MSWHHLLDKVIFLYNLNKYKYFTIWLHSIGILLKKIYKNNNKKKYFFPELHKFSICIFAGKIALIIIFVLIFNLSKTNQYKCTNANDS